MEIRDGDFSTFVPQGQTGTIKIFVDGGPDLANYAVGLSSQLDGNPVIKNVVT